LDKFNLLERVPLLDNDEVEEVGEVSIFGTSGRLGITVAKSKPAPKIGSGVTECFKADASGALTVRFFSTEAGEATRNPTR
jgi:hypothetical protein